MEGINWNLLNRPRRRPFKRKEYASILANQEYFDLCANLTMASSILKDIEDKCKSIAEQQTESQKAYSIAKSELSNIATEKAILEAENKAVGEALYERYEQAKTALITAEQRCEMLETKFVPGKEEAKQKLELAQKALKDFLLPHEAELIVEKTELEKELKRAWDFYGPFYGFRAEPIESIQNDLDKVKKALSLVCGDNHIYERVESRTPDTETFRCKRCGHEYYNRLPALWADP